MNCSTPQPPACETAPAARWGTWSVVHLESTDSTNDTARAHPVWTAVVADHQSTGRGRHGRAWASGAGGLWCSLVLPTPGDPDTWKPLPLVIGLAVIRTLDAMDVRARMRWPNDIMADGKKLAGLLLERYAPDRVVAGIGLNLTNSPAEEDPSLEPIAIRLADLCPALPSRDDFLIRLLGHVEEAYRQMDEQGFPSLITEINRIWGTCPRPVEIDTRDGTIPGDFLGIDEVGDLILEDRENRVRQTFCAAHVSQLRERETTH